jgi:biopolymer transport protein ExbD
VSAPIQSPQLKSDINVTPLVDVMLVLLIIFMLVTPMLQQGLGVSLPAARHLQTVSDNDKQVVTVVVSQDGGIHLGRTAVPRASLADELERRVRANPGLQLQIKADRNVRFGIVKEIFRVGREVGFRNAALIAEEIDDTETTSPGV